MTHEYVEQESSHVISFTRNLYDDVRASLLRSIALENIANCMSRIQYIVGIQLFHLVGWLVPLPEVEAICSKVVEFGLFLGLNVLLEHTNCVLFGCDHRKGYCLPVIMDDAEKGNS